MAQKRKGETANNTQNARQKKKQKLTDARTIAVQSLSAEPSTSKTGNGMCYRLARLNCTGAFFRYGQASEHHRRREVHRSPKFTLLLSLRLILTSGKGVRNQCYGRGNEEREVRMVSLNIREFNEKLRDGATHRVWQTLPRHLRRRAASHDVRRVPARLRGKARAEVNLFS
jgi:hypothetical protein